MSNTAAGVFFFSKNTRRFLYLLRNEWKNFTWSIPGGRIESTETLLAGVSRECEEEIQFSPKLLKLVPIQKFVNNSFVYHTFFCAVEEEFIPILNDEHCGYAWVDEYQHPNPLHPGLSSTVNIDSVQDKLDALTKRET